VLLTTLPAPRPAAPAWNLSALTDAELREFGRLLHKVTGTPCGDAAGASSSTVNGHGSADFIARGCDCGLCRSRT
jgi:hypothetical protein